MGERTCSVEGCERQQKAKGFCNLHYLRWWSAGDPGEAQPRKSSRNGMCLVAGCDSADYCKGYCRVHYARWKKHGDTSTVVAGGRPKGSRNLEQKQEVCYESMHKRVKAERGSPGDYACVECGGPAREWAYDHTCQNPVFRANGSPYSLDPAHYQPMCVSCHRRYDRKHAAA